MEDVSLRDVEVGAVVAILAQPAVRTTVDASKAKRFRLEPGSRVKLLPFIDIPPKGK